jgi:hypothetical protein
MKNKMEMKTIDGGYAKGDKKELSLLLAEDETAVLGLCYEEYADVFYYTPPFKEITKAIEECCTDAAGSKCGTYKLNDKCSLTLNVTPVTKEGKKELTMSLLNNDNKEIFRLVKDICVADAHKTMLGCMTDWIIGISDIVRDENKPTIFWLLDQNEESVLQMLEQV